jgi:hypothetical protein
VSISLFLVAALVVSSGLSAAERERLHLVIVLVGVMVALSAWAGVALHHEPWAMPSQSLWRGSATLTYANATAAFLVAPLLLSARALLLERTFVNSVVVSVLVVGWASSLSRGGGLSIVAGVALSLIVGRMCGLVRLDSAGPAKGLFVVVPGTTIALAALLPALAEHAQPRPMLALAGLLASFIVTAMILSARRPGRWAWPASMRRARVFAFLGLAIVVAAAASQRAHAIPILRAEIGAAVAGITGNRLDAQSSDRTDLLRVTWRQFADHPVFGVGPGNLNFHYVNSAGEEVQAEFTHNEYLQLAGEVGAPGLIFALSGIIGLGWAGATPTLHRSSTNVHNKLHNWHVVSLVVLSTSALHSALDFLWHIPVLPLLVVSTVGTVPVMAGKPDLRVRDMSA